MKLIIARPSPFARKVRISMLEKALPFETVVENPWLPQTTVCNANPLCKVPALVLDDGMVIHDSKVIFEYLETLGAAPHLLPEAHGARIPHKQIEAIADGICDAIVLISLENARPESMRSSDWLSRQHEKVVAGVGELSRVLGERQWFTPFGFGLADIASVCALEYIDFRYPQYDWRAAAPNLERLLAQVARRHSFETTKPQAQVLPELR